MTPAKYDIRARHGATFVLTFTLRSDDGDPMDLTGYSGQMQIRYDYLDNRVVLDISSGNGRMTLGGVDGTISVLVDANTMGEIPVTRRGRMPTEVSYVYDLKLTHNSTVIFPLEGNFLLSMDVTRPFSIESSESLPITAFGWSLLDDINAAAARSTLGLVIGSDVQAKSDALDAIALKTIPTGAIVGTTDTQTLTNKTIAAGSNSISGLATSNFAANVVDTDSTLAANSNTRLASQAAVKTYVGTSIAASAYSAGTGLGLTGSTFNITDPELLALLGLVSSANKLPYFTGSGTAALADFSAFGRTLVDDADATAARATLGLVIGTNVQAHDTDLAAISALTSAADQLPYATGTGTWAMTTLTAVARTVLDDTTTAAMLTTLGGMPLSGGNFTGLVSQSAGNGVVIGASALIATVFASGAITPIYQVHNAGAVSGMYARWGASASAPNLNFSKSRGASVGTHTAVTTNDQLGTINFAGSDGTAFRDGPRLTASVTAAPTATLCPSRVDILTNDGTTTYNGFGVSQTGDLQVNQVNVVTQARHHQLRSYTQGTLPSASTAGQEIYVSDAQSALHHAVSDGSVWRLENGQDASQAAINAQTGTTYTMLLTDTSRTVEMNNAAANTLTVPTNATAAFPIGTRIRIIQTGAGKTTIAAAGGVTINSTGGLLSIAAQWSEATLFKRATDTWVLTGALIA